MHVRTVKGEGLTLTERFGKGGEADIYAVSGDDALCAKMYREKQKALGVHQKIEEMIRIYQRVRQAKDQQEALFDRSLAWPRSKLYDPQGGIFVGFVMNRLPLRDTLKLDDFFDSDLSGRKNWNRRLNVIINVLKLLKFLHAHNIVVGDLHGANIFVFPNDEAAMVDCDSFQIARRFPVSALQSEMSPPDQDYLVYSGGFFAPSADVFCVSILVYRILMDGFNPFQYIQDGKWELDLEKSKKAGMAPILDGSFKLPSRSPPLKRLPEGLRRVLAKGLDNKPQARPSLDELIHEVEETRRTVKTPLLSRPSRPSRMVVRTNVSTNRLSSSLTISTPPHPALFSLSHQPQVASKPKRVSSLCTFVQLLRDYFLIIISAMSWYLIVLFIAETVTALISSFGTILGVVVMGWVISFLLCKLVRKAGYAMIIITISILGTILVFMQSLVAAIDVSDTNVDSLRTSPSQQAGAPLQLSRQEIIRLQTLLKKDKTIYPEGRITGNYAELTIKAVERFQQKYGLPMTGSVDNSTKQKIEEVFSSTISIPAEDRAAESPPRTEFVDIIGEWGGVWRESTVVSGLFTLHLYSDSRNTFYGSGSELAGGSSYTFEIEGSVLRDDISFIKGYPSGYQVRYEGKAVGQSVKGTWTTGRRRGVWEMKKK